MEPTKKDLESWDFNIVWEIIKKWDIGKEGLYSGATGTDVMEIVNPLRKVINNLYNKEDMVEFAGDCVYKALNPKSKMCTPNLVYIQIEKELSKKKGEKC